MTSAPNDDARAVLDFWFGAPGSATDGKPRDEWFRKSDAFDRAIEHRFAPLIESALAGGLRGWNGQADTALARILLLDQFTRNAFRGTRRSFAGDALALQAAQAMVASGQDLQLPPLQRWFVYLPYEHAEDLAVQEASLPLFAALGQADAALAGTMEYAQRHRDIVLRFGRFPHRNEILGRASTIEELAFLQEPGSSF